MALTDVKAAFTSFRVTRLDLAYEGDRLVLDITFTLVNGEPLRCELVRAHADLAVDWQTWTPAKVVTEMVKYLASDPPSHPSFSSDIVAASQATPTVIGVDFTPEDIQ